MPDFLDKEDSNKILLIVLIGAIILFYVILPRLEDENDNNNYQVENMVDVNINNKQLKPIDSQLCSPNCCKHVQWLPDEMKSKETKGTKDFIPTNLTCNNGASGGCVCMTKEDLNQLTTRGGNAYVKKCDE